MKKNKVIIISIIVIIIVLIPFLIIKKNNKNSNEIYGNNTIIINNIYTEIDKNQIEYSENTNVEELKQETGKMGNSDIYEIQTEYDGRKTLQVKPNLKYKVAFAGMIKNSKPSNSELDDIYSKNSPSDNGIWVEKSSRNKITEYFNSLGLLNSKYEINESGYLKIVEENNPNKYDKTIKNIINGNEQYILDISSICYIVDDISGEILDYNFENMDKYQTYEYFEDNNKMIIFINQNTNKQMSEKEIFESVIKLIGRL